MSEGRRFPPKKSIKNWSAYNKGLERRYDITVHLNPKALEKPAISEGKRGRPPEYSQTLIEMMLVVKAVYRLPYRGLKGFLRSVLGKEARLPDYSTVCLRAATVDAVLKRVRRHRHLRLKFRAVLLSYIRHLYPLGSSPF
ncbi:MAG: transposase [Bdellovibrionales bacterium]